MALRIFLFLLIFGILIGIKCSYLTNVEEIKVKVNKTERINDRYLIYTDKGVFSNHDSMFHGKFNSSDIYGEIKVDSMYQFKVYGLRNRFWTIYKNVKSIKKLEE